MPKKKKAVKKKKTAKKKKVVKTEVVADKSAVKAFLIKEGKVMTENSNEAREFYNQSRFGQLLEDNKVQLSLIEALYLSEKGKLVVLDGKNNPIAFDTFLKKSFSL